VTCTAHAVGRCCCLRHLRLGGPTLRGLGDPAQRPVCARRPRQWFPCVFDSISMVHAPCADGLRPYWSTWGVSRSCLTLALSWRTGRWALQAPAAPLGDQSGAGDALSRRALVPLWLYDKNGLFLSEAMRMRTPGAACRSLARDRPGPTPSKATPARV
jgi:hypothetical protein